MIPKILTLYWGGRLSYLRYLTVFSFKKNNPDWQIRVFYPEKPTFKKTWLTEEQTGIYFGIDYFTKLSELAELIPIDMENIGFSNLLPEVHKSDIVRLWALSEYGGLYSDMDILFFKPVLIPNKCNLIISYDEDNLKYCSNGTLGFSNGFLGCSLLAKSFYLSLLKLAANASGEQYQSYGPSLFNKFIQRSNYPEDVWNIPMSLVYHYNSLMIKDLFAENNKDLNSLFPESSIGCHWYGGHPATRQWENIISPSNYIFNNIKSKLAVNILS
jgi:hypothetical protein